jgi:hypothetical protein
MTEDKRYQVFVSSTYEDLKEERREVMQALLELSCMPAGMELFQADNEDQWTFIKQVIDESDYYVVIVGGRYGSVTSDGMSYTEKEYRYALESGTPIIGFLQDENSLLAKKTEADPDKKKRLQEFRELVKTKMCKEWRTADQLGAVVSRSLFSLMKKNPAIGWVRANLVPDKDAASEILALRKEIEKLQNQLAAARTAPPEGTEGLASGEDKYALPVSFTHYLQDYPFGPHTDHESKFEITWNQILSLIGPMMIGEASERDIKQAFNRYLVDFVSERLLQYVRAEEEFQEGRLSNIQIHASAFDTMKIQFRALGLIQKSDKHRGVSDKQTYWTLTPYGNRILTELRAIRRDGNQSKSENM